MLTRLKLTAIRDRLDSVLDTASRRTLTLLDTVKLLPEAEVARSPATPCSHCADSGDSYPRRAPKQKAKCGAIVAEMAGLRQGKELAPRPGLEPGTCGLTVRRSTD